MAAHIEPTPKNCIQIVMQAGLESWAVGRTKIFLKYFHIERLTQIMNSYHKAATQMEKSELGGRLGAAQSLAHASLCTWTCSWHECIL